MPVLKKRSLSDMKSPNGLYIHSNPPRVLQLSAAHIKQLIRNGDVEKLEQVVLEGQGKKLVKEYSADYKTRTFLKSVPNLISKISLLHDSVNSDRLEELKEVLDEEPEKRKKLVLAKDESGVGLLHKAIYYDLKHIYKYLIEKFPHAVHSRDSDGRTPYHYTLLCKDTPAVQKLLTNAGADPSTLDFKQHSAKYYANHLQELELPSNQKSGASTRKQSVNRESLNFKKSNIRIWIHQRNLTNLQQVVWEGHGAKLLVEHSNNPKIKKFLEAVPHIMGLVKDVHTDVVNDNMESLQNHVQPPIPKTVLSAKDTNGLTPLHKAVGLGKQDIVEYLVQESPSILNTADMDGRTPLHYSALLKDDGKMMNFLIENGADESVLDNKQKTAAYYKTRTSELDSKLLTIIPECPRTAKESFLNNFDWNMLTVLSPVTDVASKALKKVTKEEKPTEEENGKAEENDKTDETDKPEEIEQSNENDKTEENEVEENTENETEAVVNNDTENDKTEEEVHEPVEAETDAKPEETEESNEDQEKEIEKTTENDNPEEPSNENEEKEEEKAEDEEPINEPDENDDAIPENPIDDENNNTSNKEDVNEDESNKEGSKTRPHSKSNGHIPNGDIRSRPQSKIESKTRPSSKMENNEENDEGKDPDIEPEGIIEGIVNGENEVEPMNNDGQNQKSRSPETEEEIKALVDAGNMEQLATLVLNGEGEKLIGQKTDNQELQSFLENVPVYMSKINRIHLAARDGSLRDLQAALDRRKFAIAKDAISPNGASPLHVAVVFCHTSIVRYLAGRFPETIQAVDDNDRTPLHYSAVLLDNGHYFSLLTHLGADVRLQDKFGHTADYYIKNESDFSHKSLLADFGAEADETEGLIGDQDNNAENGQVDMPFFATEEGRYLASSLGDPLIKGLTEVANKRPEDPIAYLATYLYNFASSRGNLRSRGQSQENHHEQIINGSPQSVNDNNAVPASIDVVTVEPEEYGEYEDSAFNSTSRDEHGQSMLHFAAARSHGRNALFQLLLETDINVAFRDELYRTARDISIQANIPENTAEIDRYVLHIATKGDTDKLVELLLDGYDHITDIIDEDDVPIIEAVSKENQPETVSFLQSILAFEEKRERVHYAIRQGSIKDVKDLLADENETGSGKLLSIGKNSYGRCTLHIAVLCQEEEIVDYLANTFPDTLRIGDNLDRTALHYAMGMEKMETISRVLIKAGAKRVVKDLKGRQPTYYFLNKSDILRLQEEEETF